MADKHIWEIESASTMSDEDRLLIVIGTSEFLINKSDFKKALGGLSSVDTIKLSKIIIDGDGSRVLANNGEYIALSSLFVDEQVTLNADGKLSIVNNHNHYSYNNVLLVDNWVGDIAPYSQVIAIDNLTSSSALRTELVVSEDVETGIIERQQWDYIYKIVINDNSITFLCYQEKPTIDLNFRVIT